MKSVFPVLPGKGIGTFAIGCPVSQVLSELQVSSSAYGPVQVQYEAVPQQSPIYLRAPESGFHVRCDALYQCIELVTYEFGETKVAGSRGRRRAPDVLLKDSNLREAFADNVLTFDFVNSLMGPTFPYKLFSQEGKVLLRYSGICFVFDLKEES